MTAKDDQYRKKIAASSLPLDDLPAFRDADPFRDRWYDLGLDDQDYHLLQLTIAKRPEAGDLIVGTGGVRKIRFAAIASGRGKSGSYRVFYFFVSRHGLIYPLFVLAKGEAENIGKAERKRIAEWAAEIEAELDLEFEDRS